MAMASGLYSKVYVSDHEMDVGQADSDAQQCATGGHLKYEGQLLS
jgi:hypothetical protein